MTRLLKRLNIYLLSEEFQGLQENVKKYTIYRILLRQQLPVLLESQMYAGGPVIKYPTLCGLWITSGITMIIIENPVASNMFIEFGHQILEELYD